MGVDEFVGGTDDLEAYVLYGDEAVRLKRISSSRGHVGSNGKITIGRCHSRRGKGDLHSLEKIIVKDPITMEEDPATKGDDSTLQGDLRALEEIMINGSITVEGDVVTNGEVCGNGTLKVKNGHVIEGEDAGLSPIDLPELDFIAGGPNIWVRRKHPQRLPPGSYGKVRVMRGSALYLSSGEYFMERLRIGRGAIVRIDPSDGPITINVVKRLRIRRHGRIEKVTLNVLNDRRIWIGPHAEFEGTLIAPNSRVRFGHGSELEGAVYARKIWAGRKVRFQPHPD